MKQIVGKMGLPYRALILLLTEGALIVLLVYGFLKLGAGTPDDETLLFRPAPDTAEQAYVSRAFAFGQNPLLPIVNELHPSRFSPVHPFLASLWIRLNAGNPDSIFQWSLVSILSGMLLFYILLIQSGAPGAVRILFVYLILYTPLLLSLSGKFLQEPTMFLLFAGACAAWHKGMILSQTLRENAETKVPGRNIGSSVFFLFSGILCGALICIRITLFPLTIFLVLFAIREFPVKKAWKPCLAFILGHLFIIILVMIYMMRLADIFFIQGYFHWMPDYRPFAWGNAFKPPINRSDGIPHYLLIVRELLGIQKTVVVWGWLSMTFLIFFGILGFLIPRSPESQDRKTPNKYKLFRSLLFFLFLFGLSQILFHLFYFFHDLRFFILAYPIIILCGLTGWWEIFRFLQHTTKMKKILIAITAILTGIVLAGGYNAIQGYDILTNYKKASPSPSRGWREKFIHKEYGARIRRLHCPLFVDKIPVLNARLLLDLEESPFPIAPLTREFSLYFESHTVQFLWYKVKPAAQYLDNRSLWKGDPPECYLYDQEKKQVRREFTERLINHYGKLAIYYPEWRRRDLAEFFSSLNDSLWEMKNLSRDPGWNLIVVMKKNEY